VVGDGGVGVNAELLGRCPKADVIETPPDNCSALLPLRHLPKPGATPRLPDKARKRVSLSGVTTEVKDFIDQAL
jgi:hypothetical protein